MSSEWNFPTELDEVPLKPFCSGLPKASFKKSPETFIVEEIDLSGNILKVGDVKGFLGGEGDFLHIVVEKRNWSSDLLAKRIARALGISRKRVSFAGSKDKRATTTQLMSIYKGDPEKVLSLKIKDVNFNAAWLSHEPVKMGMLKGNHFHIYIPGHDSSCLSNNAYMFPNYYGPQRFGLNNITHKVGYLMLKGKFEEAALLYITSGKEQEPAKMNFYETRNYTRALKEFPKHLKHERTLLAHLHNHPRDFVNAFRKLPRPLLLMFVHAIQSFLFNYYVEERIHKYGELPLLEAEYRCSSDNLGFPDLNSKGADFLCAEVPGYLSKLNWLYEDILSKFGISKQDFNLSSLPEISSKGTYRPVFVRAVSFSESNGWISFSLPSGSYASVLLREIASF